MKTLSLAIISSAIVLASCSSSKYATSSEYDDVYYNPNEAVVNTTVSPQAVMEAQPLSQTEIYAEPMVAEENLSDYEQYRLQREAEMLGQTYTPEGSEALYAEQQQVYDTLDQYGEAKSAVVINNYNYYTDPNEYYYSSNLRRFSDSYYGWDYYDPYYTSYGFRGSRFNYGLSMGFGYGMGMGLSYGYPYYGGYYPSYYGFGGWYDPYSYYGYGYPYYGYGGFYSPYYRGSYWSGYNYGFYNGYYTGRYGSSYYSDSNYRYGRMDSRHYAGYNRPSRTTVGSAKSGIGADTRYRTRSSEGSTAATKNAAVRNNDRAVRTTRTSPASRATQSRTARSTYSPNYSKPRTSAATNNRSAVQSRSAAQSRSYNQTQTRSSSQRAATYNPRSTTQQRSSTSYNRPSRSSSSYSRPSSSSRSSSSYSRPSSSSRSSSYRSSSPSRSSSSYSRSSSPSRSSSSYSRSSSSSSRSSGSSSGGSRSSSGGSSRSGGSRR